MNDTQLRLILDYLDKIGLKLGVGVNEIWPWFIRQQYVEVVHNLGYATLSICIFCFGTRFIKTHWDPEKTDIYSITGSRNKDSAKLFIIISSIIAVLFVCIFISSFADIFNPEYAAFKDIVSMIPEIDKS